MFGEGIIKFDDENADKWRRKFDRKINHCFHRNVDVLEYFAWSFFPAIKADIKGENKTIVPVMPCV